MNVFTVEADAYWYSFLSNIAAEMESLFGITNGESVARVNEYFKGEQLFGSENGLLDHEEPSYWANEIYYGHDSHWWTRPDGLLPKELPGSNT